MLEKKEIAERFYQQVGEDLTKLGERYVLLKRVEMEKVVYKDNQNFDIYSKVAGRKIFGIHIAVKEGKVKEMSCPCEAYQKKMRPCKHIVATMKYFEKTEERIDKKEPIARTKMNDVKYKGFKQMIHSFSEEEKEGEKLAISKQKNKKGNIRIEPKIIYDKISSELKVEFQIGRGNLYRIKNLSEFYERMLNHENYQYGEKLEFVHDKEEFEEVDQPLLEFILKYGEIIRYVNSNSNPNNRFTGKAMNEGSITLSHTGLDEIFDLFQKQTINFEKDHVTEKVQFLSQNPTTIEFLVERINEKEYKLLPNIDIYKMYTLKGKDFTYILYGKKLYRCDEKYKNTVLKLIDIFKKSYSKEMIFPKEQLPELFSMIMPKIKEAMNIKQVEKEDLKKYMPKDLRVKVYLDFDKNDYMIAEVRFCYEDQEFNPLDEKSKITIPRNRIQEEKAFQAFQKTGFMFEAKKLRFVLPKEEKIYYFLTEEIEEYTRKFEVLVTDHFKNKQITKPKITNLGIKVENNLLSIDLTNLNIDIQELKDIMEKYNLKKKYHRLKNGDFLSLEENDDLAFIDKLITDMDIEYDELSEGRVSIPASRSLYLNQILKKMNHTEVTKNEEYKNIVNGLNKEQLEENMKIPEELDSILRYYQKTGFKWLKVLDHYQFGGILADDMGLRKNDSIIICSYCLY